MTNISHDSETPAHGQQVITACAFIHHNFDGIEKVFLPRRAATKKFLPNVYELPGGHIEFGEDIVVGLKREIEEELGMDITVGDPFAVFTYSNAIKGSHSIEVDYFATFIGPLEKIHINPADHSTYGWFAETELLTLSGLDNITTEEEVLVIKKGFALLSGARPRFQ